MTPIDLDHNATTPTRPEVWAAMRPAWDAGGNPASAHHAGRTARRYLEDARERVAALIGAAADEVVFTSGATEANNLALFGLAGEPGHILAAPIEHPCVIEPLKQLGTRGFAVEWLPVTHGGHVEQRAVVDRVRPDTRLVALMLANHETGALQPVRHVAKTLPKHVLLHCDAAQAVGKIPVNFRDLGVTSLTASGHKFGGPKGVGVLVLKRGTPLRPLLFGGHQQRGHRPGTEPVPLAVGFAAALELAVREMDANRAKLEALRARFLNRLRFRNPSPQPPPRSGEGESERVSPPLRFGEGSGEGLPFTLNSPPDALPTTLNLSFPGCRSDVLLMALDLAGVACSTGSACSSGSLLPSPVLQAMGVPDEVLRSAIRFSFGPTLTEADIDDAADRVAGCVKQILGERHP